MALGKAFPTQYGAAIKATYWKIANAIEDFIAGQVKVTLAGYASAEDRQAGAMPLAVQEATVLGENYTPDKSRAELYAMLKTAAQWADAEDC